MRRFMRMDRYPERGAARRRTDETMDRRRYRQWNCHWETIRYLNSSKKLLLTAKAQRAQRFFSIKKALLNFKWVKKARQEKRNTPPVEGEGVGHGGPSALPSQNTVFNRYVYNLFTEFPPTQLRSKKTNND